METETHSNYGATISEPSHAEHEANALDSGACPRCYPRQYAASHSRHRATQPECNGICVMASELIEFAPNVAAYPHPDCDLHAPRAVSA